MGESGHPTKVALGGEGKFDYGGYWIKINLILGG